MSFLLEDGFNILLEDGFQLVLEDVNTANNPPTIDVQPVDTSVKDGLVATFTVAASDIDMDPLTYQWYETPGDTPLAGETATSLAITTEMADSGRMFYCIVDDGVL